MISLILKYLPSVVIPTIITLLITIIYGRFLTPASFGDYNLFVTTVTVINNLFFLFLTVSLLRFYNSYKGENQQNMLLGTYLVVLLIISVTLSLILFPFLGEVSFVLIGCVSSLVILALYTNLIRAKEKVWYFNIVKISTPLFTLLSLLYFISLDNLNTTTALISFYVPMTAVSLVITIIIVITKQVEIKIDKPIVVKTIKYGYPLAIASILGVLLSAADRYMIKYFLGSEEVGLYSFAYRISELMMVNVTLIIILALYPRLIKMYDEKKFNLTRNTLNKYIDLHLMIIIPLVFLIFLFVEEAVNLLFPLYNEAVDVIKYVSLGTLFFSLSYYTNKTFELTKKTGEMVKLLFISTIINISLNYILIPVYGVMGSAIATIFAYLIYVLLSVISSRKLLNIRFYYKNITLYVLMNILVTLIINNIFNAGIEASFPYLLLKVFLYVLLYSACLYLLINKKIIKHN